MKHADFLSQMPGLFSGSLDARASEALRQHLESCGPCARIAARWPRQAPAPGLEPAVMQAIRNLEQAPGSARLDWALPRLAPIAAALALALLLGAFWHPERAWLRADRSFASFGSSGPHVSAAFPRPGVLR